MRKIALAFALLAGLIAPAFAQKSAIDAANAKFVELFNKGDFAGIGELYAEEAVALPPGAPMVKGRVGIALMWKGLAEQVSDPKLQTLDLKRIGITAIREIGTYSLKTKEATPKELTGKYVVVWRKIKGRWKLATDIWNDGK